MKEKLLFEAKLWFVNIVLLVMWITAIVLDVLPMVKVNDDSIRIALFAITGIIPTYFIYEAIAIGKRFQVDVKDPYSKTDEKKEA